MTIGASLQKDVQNRDWQYYERSKKGSSNINPTIRLNDQIVDLPQNRTKQLIGQLGICRAYQGTKRLFTFHRE
jgi:hypothetical protein